MVKYGRYCTKKGMEKAAAAGLQESDFDGEGKITMPMINKKLKPKKPKKTKKPKKSAYKAQYFTGENEEAANLIGQFFTTNHSDKIKAGNRLEHDVADDVQEHSSFSFYKAKNINDPEVVAPCVIASCRFSKEQYEKYGLKCKNKKEVEVDLVIISADKAVSIVELKNGCDFDTKKSKGEVQSLEATKTLCENIGYTAVECCICCYDAMEQSDMKLKTTMGQVVTILYSELAEKCGLNGDESRQRIDQKVQMRAHVQIQKLEDFISSYQAMKM
jgi:hypothetical protein